MSKNTKPIKLKSADYLYFSRCGRYLAASKVQGRIALYDARDGSLLWQDKPLKNIDMLAFSPCGQWLSVTAEGGHWCVLAVEDVVQVAAGRHPRQTHGVFNALHFLPDGSGLFNIERYTYLDKQTAPSRWENSREVTAWSFPDGVLQGVRQLDLPFSNCQVFQNPMSGRYVMLHTLPAPLENGNSTISYALHTWQGNPLTAELVDIPPPAVACAPDEAPGTGRWKWIENIGFAANGDMAVLLQPGYAHPGYALLLTDGETFAPRAFAPLPDLEAGYFKNCAVGTEIVATAHYAGETGGVYFHRRDDLSLIAYRPYPAGITAIAFHPGGTGMALAARAKSVYYPDFPQSEAGLIAWWGNKA